MNDRSSSRFSDRDSDDDDRFSDRNRTRDTDSRFSDRDDRFSDRNDRDDRFSDRDDRFSDRNDRDDRFSDRDSRSSDRDDRFSDRDDRSFDRDTRFSDRDDRSFDRDSRFTDRDSRSFDRDTRSSSRSRTDLNVNINSMRSADLGLWVSARNNNLLITDVDTSGPLARLGFRENDYIYSVAGTRIASERDFIRYLFEADVDRVPVVVYRNSRYQTIYVEPTVLVETTHYTSQRDPLEEFGIVLDDRWDDRIVVWRVMPRTPAWYAGIRAGDVITTFHGRRLSEPKQFVSVIEEIDAGDIDVQVLRNNQQRQLSVEVPESFVSERHTTYRRDADLDNNDNGRLDRRDIRQERREDRQFDRDLNNDWDITTPGATITTPGGDVNITRPGGVNVQTPGADVNVGGRGGLFRRRN